MTAEARPRRLARVTRVSSVEKLPAVDNNYPPFAIALAKARGYDERAHLLALEEDDEDAISLIHPYNFLTEEQVEKFAMT